MGFINFRSEISDVSYTNISGVLINDQLMDYSQFSTWIKKNMQDAGWQKNYENFLIQWHNIEKNIFVKTSKKGQVYSVEQFQGQLENIANLFTSTIIPGLGGTISLITSFNMDTKTEQEIYFLGDEKQLPSVALEESGKRFYFNTKEQLESLTNTTIQLKKLNDTLKHHQRQFYNQLRNRATQTDDDRKAMYKWAQQNIKMQSRLKQLNNASNPTIARFFWGRGKIAGYVSEAFGAHLALIHPNVLFGNHVDQLANSVINEHGGPGSEGLFELLASTKGQVMSQLSGDIVVIDSEGRVIFNIQAKGSRKSNYTFTITYQRFLKNIETFISLIPKRPEEIMENDIKTIFKMFETTAWRPIQTKINSFSDQIIDNLIKS